MHAHPDRLVLYHTRWCGYCVRVWRAIEGLGLTVEARDIDSDPQARADLVAVRGRSTVPVLRISFAQGPDRWMPESADIIRYLRGLEGDLKAGR